MQMPPEARGRQTLAPPVHQCLQAEALPWTRSQSLSCAPMCHRPRPFPRGSLEAPWPFPFRGGVNTLLPKKPKKHRAGYSVMGMSPSSGHSLAGLRGSAGDREGGGGAPGDGDVAGLELVEEVPPRGVGVRPPGGGHERGGGRDFSSPFKDVEQKENNPLAAHRCKMGLRY